MHRSATLDLLMNIYKSQSNVLLICRFCCSLAKYMRHHIKGETKPIIFIFKKKRDFFRGFKSKPTHDTRCIVIHYCTMYDYCDGKMNIN